MARPYGQFCGVARALELVGERWALLIVRDLLVGPRRYSHLQRGLPGIPTNILAARLKELQAAGVIHRVPLAHGLVYELTAYGRELEDVVLALGRWGFQAMTEPADGDVVTADSMTMAFRTAFRPEVAAGLPPTVYGVHLGEIRLTLEVVDGALHVTSGAPPATTLSSGASTTASRSGSRSGSGSSSNLASDNGPGSDLASGNGSGSDVASGNGSGSGSGSGPGSGPGPGSGLTFGTGPAIRSLIAGELSPADAVDRGLVEILDGDPALLERFAQTFHLEPAVAPAHG